MRLGAHSLRKGGLRQMGKSVDQNTGDVEIACFEG